MLLLITGSASSDPRDNVIIRLTCTCISVICEDNGKFILREINSAVLMKQSVSKYIHVNGKQLNLHQIDESFLAPEMLRRILCQV